MRILHIVHRQFAPVDSGAFCDVIVFEGFLKQQISGIRLITKHFGDCGPLELCAEPCRDTFPVKCVGNQLDAHTRKVHIKNPFYNLRFFRHDREHSVNIPVAEHRAVPGLAFFEVFLYAPLLVFTDRQ